LPTLVKSKTFEKEKIISLKKLWVD